MTDKKRLDKEIVDRAIVETRSQAENFIKLGLVSVDGRVMTKPGEMVVGNTKIILLAKERYVSRAGMKLESVAKTLNLRFQEKIVLDVGSSTGGFTDFALQHGAKKVVCVDIGTNQLHQSLRTHPRIELHEKTDVRNLVLNSKSSKEQSMAKNDNKVRIQAPDIILMDVSFISVREILPSIANLSSSKTQIVVMVKPQFEASAGGQKHKGVIKNDTLRRKILQDFEVWIKKLFVIVGKADSEVIGAKGNRERFYKVMKLQP